MAQGGEGVMVSRKWPVLLPLLALLAGCFGQEDQTPLVPDNPFRRTPPAPPTRTTYAPATTEAAARVDFLGRNLLAANPQLGIRPLFRTIGAPQPEIFHRGTAELYITEGLVKQCISDGQLAALLCLELGKMIAEREALAGPRSRESYEEPPPEVSIGNNYGTYGEAPDLIRLAELAKFRPPAQRTAALPLPDPQVLARDYLQKAGFAPTELDTAAPLLRTAASSAALEKSVAHPAAIMP